MYVVSCGVLYWFCGAPAAAAEAAAEVSHDDNNKSKTAVQRVVWDHLCTTPGVSADVVHTAHRNCDMITIGP